MAHYAYVLLLALVRWLHISHAAAAAAAAQPTCDTGSSRILMANLDHLPAQCKPGHQPIAAAVMECFVSSRVVVHECRVVMLPGRPTSKAGLDCRVMHARGVLTGPANASLTGVLDSSKAASMLQVPASQQLLQGLDAAKLQQQLVQGMQLLFGQVTITTATNSTSRKGAAPDAAAETVQPGADGQNPTGGAAAAGARNSTPAAQQQNRRHHPRLRPSSNDTQGAHEATAGNSSTGSSSSEASETDHSSSSAPGAAQVPAAANTSMAGPGVTNATGSTPAAAGGGSTTSKPGAAHADTSAQPPQAHTPSTAASNSTGRKLLQELRSLVDAPAPAAAGASGAQDDSVVDDTAQDSTGEADLQDEAAAAAAAASSALAGAVLYRQASSVILQPSSICGYQFLVTRNPRLLQPEPDKASGGGVGAMQPRSRRSHDRSWWVSAGALFAGVSAVLALVICYMSTQLWNRYRSYEALPSEPAPTDEQQHPQQQGSQHSTRVEPPLSTAYLGLAPRPEMSLELQQTRSKNQPGSDADNVSLHDQQHPAD